MKRSRVRRLAVMLSGLCLVFPLPMGWTDPVLDGLIVTNGDFRKWDAEKPADWTVPAGVSVARNERGGISFTNNTDQRQYVGQSYPGPKLVLQKGDVLFWAADITATEKSSVTLEIWIRYVDESVGKREIGIPVSADGKCHDLRCTLPVENEKIKHVWFLIGLRTPGSSCVVRRVEGRVIPAAE